MKSKRLALAAAAFALAMTAIPVQPAAGPAAAAKQKLINVLDNKCHNPVAHMVCIDILFNVVEDLKAKFGLP